MEGGLGSSRPGHSNRVFSLKYFPSDENILLSGGWDNTVQIWDVRANASVRSIFGPHLCGDAMDVHKNTILTGSWRSENPLELWDFGSGKLIESVSWNQGKSMKEACLLYSAQFNQGGSMIAAGGSGANEAKVFDHNNGNKLVGTIAGLTRAVFSVDWGVDNTIAIAGGDHNIRVCQVEGISSSAGETKD
jgi:COMPASS component SWD3